MSWNDHLLPEQERAASHFGSHARLLAGPGTGKTLVLTRRILYLIQEQQVSPDEILALTFTRAAAHELRQRVSNEINEGDSPRIMTLHSFALRQLLLNSGRLITLPQPLRIADDWEERHIILEDLKTLLQLEKIQDARELLNQLSSDWESLAADEGMMTPNPRFIGAWEEHRKIYGYTLRAELVYQLKRSLEQIDAFELEAPARHLLVDEYQDLNLCDLAVIRTITTRGVELFIAGDDDQSIYGFRKAYPEGIRSFLREYPDAQDIPLHICKRCDPEILDIAEFVADLDTQRIRKATIPEEGHEPGEVALLRFGDETVEADGIAKVCKGLIDHENLQPDEILILLRADTRRAFSRELEDAFLRLGVPIVIDPGSNGPLDEPEGRQVLELLRLANNRDDHLAWTTLLRLRRNGIGPTSTGALYKMVRTRGERFSQAIRAVAENPDLLQRFGKRVSQEFDTISQLTNRIQMIIESASTNSKSFQSSLNQITTFLGTSEHITNYLIQIAIASEAETLSDLLTSIEATSVNIEPELESGRVNVLTMHKAKGLTARAVIVMAAEDEHIPGRQDREPELGDERRLLYVSLTRAKHRLFITYCDKRLGQQRMLGRNPGNSNRTLTQFLRHTPLRPLIGQEYLRSRWNF